MYTIGAQDSVPQHQLTTGEAELPYYEIPEYPDSYTATSVAARMIDAFGFRYYWATEGLREEDLVFQPDASARSTHETLYHIYGLATVIHNSVNQRPSIRPLPEMDMTFNEMRAKTLHMIKETSDILKASSPEDLEDYKVIFQRGDNRSEFPFWNQLNGPIADALWHTGQVVSFRRASGNPFDFRASVFMGKRREG